MGNDRGAAMVEMAIVSILLILLVMGIVDLGRVVFTNISLRDAVQEGATYFAFTDGATDGDIKDTIANAVSSPDDISPGMITLYCTDEVRELQSASRIRVEMEYDVDLITPLVGTFLGGSLTLNPVAEAERYYECPPSVPTSIP